MARFYGKVKGKADSPASRIGNENSGIETVTAAKHGAIRTTVRYDPNTGKDTFIIEMIPWNGSGGTVKEIASGEVHSNMEVLEGPTTFVRAKED